MDYKKTYQQWLDSEYLTEEEKEELRKMSEEEIVSSFSSDIDFGTGGIRGLMGLGTNKLNKYTIYKASTGVGLYLKRMYCERSVVICYDNRKNSKEFCDIASIALAHLGVKVYKFSSLRTTPQLSFYTQLLDCSAGIMITASHNPKEYNGFKVYNKYGGQLIKEDALIVKQYINKVADYLNLNVIYNPLLINKLDDNIDEIYYKMVSNTSIQDHDFSNIKVVYSPSHGTGLIPVKTILERKKANLILVEEQSYPSKTFENTENPNPEEQASYKAGLKYLIDNKADIFMVSDPDCDRIGACLLDKNNEVQYINGNQMGLILTNYILSFEEPKEGKYVVSTLVSSCLIEKFVKSFGFKYISVFTGFKNIGNEIIKDGENFVFGFEESYGYLRNPAVKDKDAVQASILIAEMVSYYKNKGLTLLDVLDEIYAKIGHSKESQQSIKLVGNDANEKKNEIMNKAYNFDLDEICGYKIKEVINYNIGLNLTKNTPVGKGDNLVKIIFEDDSFIAIRPSGTEPKIKIYFSIISDKNNPYKANLIKDFFINYLKD